MNYSNWKPGDKVRRISKSGIEMVVGHIYTIEEIKKDSIDGIYKIRVKERSFTYENSWWYCKYFELAELKINKFCQFQKEHNARK